MRLTLRTLLAYMDGILEAKDAEDIGKRIQESEQATNLLHRTRDVMRRLRLAAPSLTERGPGLDPNTVAEYLDNTLPDDRVADFEKVCLDSDMHLAEVAACHQILALVLGEAAEIDPASRDRMYQLPAQQSAEAPPPAAAPEETPSGGDEPAGMPAARKRRKPTVPDYLREPPRRRRVLFVGVTVAMVACVAAIVWGTVFYWPGLQRAEVQGPAGGQPESPPPTPDERPATQPAEQPVLEPSEEPAAVLPEEPIPAPPGEPGIELPEEPPSEPAGEPRTEPAEPAVAAPDGEPQVAPAEPPLVVELPQPPQGQGGLMSDRQVLLRFDPVTSLWQRVPTQGIVVSGEKLLSLPTYRPLLALMSAEITVQLVDGTQAELLPTDLAGVPGLKADFGRLVIRTVGRPAAQLRLQIGNHNGLVTFADAKSAVALDVTAVHEPGTDPEANPGRLVTAMYATGGEIAWEETPGQQAVRIPAGSWVTLSEEPVQTPVPIEPLPKWIGGEDADSLEMGADRLASANLERELQVDRSLRLGAGLVLMELNEHARRENRWLAARCLGYVGDFGPLVAAPDDPNYPPVWTDQAIEHLRAGIARGPETAARVRQALEKQYGQNADKLYRMLWGYTEEELKAHEAATLVEYLDDQSLAVRTLSFWNLRDIFGLGLLYDPAERETVRKARTQRWRERLQSGDIWPKRPAQPAAVPAAEP